MLSFFFSVFALQATTTAVEKRAWWNGRESDEQAPVLIPTYGIPYAMEIPVWYCQNDEPSKIAKTFAKVQFQCDDEIDQTHMSLDEKKMIIGIWDSSNLWPESPSSVISLGIFRRPIADKNFGTYNLCVRNIGKRDSLLTRLLQKFNQKSISFWWDSITPKTGKNKDDLPIGEMAIGSPNSERFVAGTEVEIKAKPTFDDPLIFTRWTAAESLHILVGSKTMKSREIAIDFKGFATFLPTDIYEELTKPLRIERSYTVGLMKGISKDISQHITGYLDMTESIHEFDCKDGAKLSPIQIGTLTIPPQMLFKKVSTSKCAIAFKKYDKFYDDTFTIGIDLIRKFHVTIQYHENDGESLFFSTRVDGKAPSPKEPPASAQCPKSGTIYNKFMSYVAH